MVGLGVSVDASSEPQATSSTADMNNARRSTRYGIYVSLRMSVSRAPARSGNNLIANGRERLDIIAEIWPVVLALAIAEIRVYRYCTPCPTQATGNRAGYAPEVGRGVMDNYPGAPVAGVI